MMGKESIDAVGYRGHGREGKEEIIWKADVSGMRMTWMLLQR